GDVLLQVVFHARVAAERGPHGFTIDDVADAIIDKLVRRHPHVFSTTKVAGADEVRANWEAIKAAEREAKGEQADVSMLAGVPFGQPAALLAYELQKRDRKSTRLNSSHVKISYAVFCLKKKKKKRRTRRP